MVITEKTSFPNVAVIPATKRSTQNGGQWKKQSNIRVAAYCRVSTGDESQQTSYTNQKAFYTELIRNRDGWQFAGIYADEAISGTSRARRREFNRMMEDAKHARLDYIITKSISRFARNTVDTLNCVRELRQQTPPVGIFFEKENIDTLDAAGELILTILSALAQDESRSISDNIRWTFRKNFQAGIPQINLKRMLGYDKAADGTWVINPAQAVIVRYIFERYVCGQSANRIAGELNELGYRTVNEKAWTSSSVLTVLRNEKYVGDLEMQKTITKDFLSHRSVINRGEAPRYYVENHHIGIIDRLTWDKVQAMLYESPCRKKEQDAAGKRKKGPKKSPFSSLRCGALLPETGEECGEKLFRMTYTGTISGYQDERSLAATGGDTSRYLEKYSYAYPIWRCRRKMQEKGRDTRDLQSGKDPGIAQHLQGGKDPGIAQHLQSGKDTCNQDLQSDNNYGEDCIHMACPSGILHECAIEQSFMELLYHLKRDYETHGEESRICTMFREAYDRTYQQVRENSPFIQRLETLDRKIQELEENLKKTMEREAMARRTAELERGRTSGKPETKHYDYNQETPEAAVYTNLARELRQRIAELRQERSKQECEDSVISVMQKNFTFFLKCLVELPEQNSAGMKLVVNGLDEQDQSHLPDYLQFERGIYIAFIERGIVRGDAIEYTTNFGVKLTTVGNKRTLGSFIGYKRCKPDGTVELLDAPYKICGNSIQYRRYLRKGAKEEDK